MNQVPAAEHLGRTVGEVTGQHEIERALREVIERGEPLLDVDIALHGRRFEASYFPVRDDRGELLAVGKAMIDVTARRRAESARERLQDATSALAGAVTVADVAAVAVEQARRGARRRRAAVLLLLDAERERAARSSPTRASADGRASAGGRSPLAEPMPADRGRAHRAGRLRLRRGRRCWSAIPGSTARRTRARARTRRCRWSPTGARSACSRSASRARSRSTPTSAAC